MLGSHPMLPLEILGRHRFPDGRELVLYHRDGTFQIRIDGLELMTSRAHGSEEALARLASEALGCTPAPRILVGGLGMGYTLRAALDAFGERARVTVAELLSVVVQWNRGPLGPLAAHPLDDPRVILAERDLAELLADADDDSAYDVILLDVDNGPGALSVESNAALYSTEGLRRISSALRDRGVLAVWSADEDRDFQTRLEQAGFAAGSESVSARGRGGGPMHTVFLGRKPG